MIKFNNRRVTFS